jgi:Ca-activated chloride channel family protein
LQKACKYHFKTRALIVSGLLIRRGILLIGCCMACCCLEAQYYLAGTTVDSSGKPLAFVKIRLHSTGILYESGGPGAFGIPSPVKKDSVTCFLHGYDTLRSALIAGANNVLTLSLNRQNQIEAIETNGLSSQTKNLLRDPQYTKQAWGESYNEVIENGFVNTPEFPTTAFSPNGNNASYSNIRRFINNKVEVTPDAVRLEEMLNYFSLSVAKAPPKGRLFNLETRISDCPWKSTSKLLFVNARAATLELDKVPPANLVFLIDNSGSMDMPNRLPLLKSAFKMLARNLRDTDRVSIVTYGGNAGIMLPPTSGREKDKIIREINGIMPGGATPGSNGIQMAYDLAINTSIPNGNNRVILATDGDFNVGITEENALINLIEQYRHTGVFLTCLGVGMGNYKDSKIEVLAKHGNGNFAYLDKETEAEKVLVKELTQNLYAVASDVTMHIDLDPAFIRQYRLIGYDNRREAVKDSTSKLFGSEIGSGYSMVSIFEIEPADTSFGGLQKLVGENIGKLRVECIDTKTGKTANTPAEPVIFNYQPFSSLDPGLRFAAALTMFGSILRKSPFTPGIGFDQVKSIAAAAADNSDPLQLEFVELVEQAKQIYLPEKHKKWQKKKDE